MSFLQSDYQDEKLDSFRLGTLEQGLKIGCALDEHLVWKQSQFNMMIGIDNVGKTFYKAWYYTCLAKIHGITFDIFSIENQVWAWKSKIISFYTGKHISKLDDEEFIKAKSWVDNHFTFIDEKKFYNINDLLNLFKSSDSKGCLIDPLNALDEPSGANIYQYNKEILKQVRHFCANTGKTVEIVGHAGTEASRRIHRDGEFSGFVMPPEKSHIDGGQIFPNRCDDFVILHRYFAPDFRDISFLFIDKIKETETGGKRTNAGEPIELHFREYGFWINGVNPLSDKPLPVGEVYDKFGGLPNNDNIEQPF